MEIFRLLNFSMDSTKIAPEDSFTAFESLASNVEGYALMADFVEDYIEKLFER